MTMPSNDSDINVATDRVLDLAAQLSNDGSQPSQQGEQNQEQRVPYERFKDVNDERKSLQEQNSKLMEMIQQFQTMQQQNQNRPVETNQPAQTQTGPAPLFTEDELNSFEQDIVLDPKTTLQRFGDAILTRGVDTRVKALQEGFEAKLAQLTGQMQAQTIPAVIADFKSRRFGPGDAAEVAAFDQAAQSVDPSLLSNPATLENIRLAAIGYVADQRRTNPQQNNQAFFSETPGGSGVPGGWGGLSGTPAAPQIPQQVIEAARKMGVDPKEAAAMYQAMNTSGVFRT